MKAIKNIIFLVLLSLNSVAEINLDTKNHLSLSELKILADNTQSHQEFGHAVSISGNYAAISTIQDDDNGNSAGAVYVYENLTSGWQQKQKLTGTDTDDDDLFGYSVSVNTNRIVIGAIGVNTSGLTNSGAVYIFEKINNSWTQTHKLIADTPTLNARFGTAVSLDGDNLVIGSPGLNNDTGKAFVYNFNTSTQLWTQVQTLVDNNAIINDNFGHSISLFGQRVLVGVNTGIFTIEPGYATLFENLSNNQQVRFSATNANGAIGFGYSVSLYNNRALVGALFDSPIGSRSGSAYLFEYDKEDLIWQQTQNFSAVGTTQNDNTNFGNSVAVYADRIIIGSYRARPNSSSGTSFLYEFENNQWIRTQIVPSDGSNEDQFGFSVALTDQWIVIGANHDDNGVQISDAGAAYMYFGDIIFVNAFE